MRHRQLARGVGLSFVWVLVPWGLIELSLILFEPWPATGPYEYDPDIGFRVRPYAHESNRFGFNDADHPLEKPAGGFRVILLGDSFGWAGGRDRNYSALLRTKLQTRFGPSVEVINTGYPMTQPGEQLKILEKYALQYEPDLLLLGFFAGNDFVDSDPLRRRVILNGIYFDVAGHQPLPTAFGRPIIGRSRLWPLISQRIRIHRGIEEPASPEGPLMSESAYLGVVATRLYFYLPRLHATGMFQSRIEHVFSSLAGMRDLAERNGAAFVVAIFPDELSVHRDVSARALRQLRIRRGDFDPALPHALLKGHLDSLAVSSIDLLPAFERKAGEERLYLSRNTHWNDAGNALAADVLYSDLEARLAERLAPPEIPEESSPMVSPTAGDARSRLD